MPYFIVDLEKPSKPLNEANFEAHRVFLFAKRKINLRTALQYANGHGSIMVMHVKDNEKMSYRIAKLLKKILKKDNQAVIQVMSRRKKVAHAMKQLSHDYPDAKMSLIDKNVENQIINENPNNITTAKTAEATVGTHTPLLLAKPKPVPLLSAPKTLPENPQQYDLKLILNLLKKNRPRKKAALQSLLVKQFALSDVALAAVLGDLLAQGVLRIDTADNVKYLN